MSCPTHQLSPPVFIRQVRHAVRVAMYSRPRPKRVSEDGPLFKAQCLAQRISIGGQVLHRHGGNFGSRGTTVASVVIEDQGELIRTFPERH
jgi:hypothetical protein